MGNIIEATFFFLHRQIEKLNSIFSSKKIPLILAPMLPFSVVILCAFQLINGVYILFNSIILVLGIILTFLLGVSSFYFYKNDSIFARCKREKSNKNLSQFQSNEISLNIINEKKVLDILENNKDKISHYYFELRKIELFDFDTSLDDFKYLISNSFKKSSDNYTFKLEVSAYEAHYFIREFLVPFLGKLNESVVVPKKNIASLLKYKNNDNKYLPINIKSFSTKGRISYTDDQKKLYDSVKMA